MAERAVVLDPLSAIINVNSGRSAGSNVGRFDEALVAYQPGNRDRSDDGRLRTGRLAMLACVWLRSASTQAVPWYEKAVSLDPGNPADLGSRSRNRTWTSANDAEAERLARSERWRWATRRSRTSFMAALFCTSIVGDDGVAARKHAQRAAELDPGRCMFLHARP